MSKKKEEQLAQAQKTAEAARQAAAPQSGYSTADLNSRSDVQNALAGAEYRPSQNVTDAANDLKQWQQNRPGQYQSAYQDKMDELMDALLGRDSFQYSYAQDPLYRQYAQLYTQNAANASADAAAQAAALTGGYGSSYAASVAQQAYQQQIGALSEAIPTLYRLALDTYTGGGEELVTKLDQLGVREQNDQNLYNNELADYYTILRDGVYVSSGAISDITEERMVSMMVGRAISQTYPKVDCTPGETVLEVTDLCHPTEFAHISFRLRKGEILGFYGLVGAGRTELMQALSGVSRPSSGEIRLNGRTMRFHQPADAIRAGIVCVPEERQKQGAIIALPIAQNISLPQLSKLNPNGILNDAREWRLADEYASRLQVKAFSWRQPVETLSGGNQQKVVIGKWLATQPEVIILDEPTKGIDIGSKAAVHQFMSELVSQGLAVIMVSSELPEVMGMADRIIVMHEGLMVAEYQAGEATAETIVSAASGIGQEAA